MNGGRRVEFIDCAKGITILLVILGHTLKNGGRECALLRGAIFSFHMPLFFILSCYVYRYSKNDNEFYEKTKKAAKHLLIPAFALVFVGIFSLVVADSSLFLDLHFWRERALSIVFFSGVNVSFGKLDIPGVGMPWFFVALFLGRTIYDYIHLKFENRSQLMIICVILSLLGVLLGASKRLPFSLDIALAVMPFFYIGEEMSEEKYPQGIILPLIIWGPLFILTYPSLGSKTYLEIAVRRYPLYPICFMVAIAGTILLCNLCKKIVRLGTISKPLLFLGKNSMYMYMVHCVDTLPFIMKIWNVSGNEFITAAARIGLDFVMFAAVMGICFFGKKLRLNGKQNESVRKEL